MTKKIFRAISFVVCLSLILSSVPWSPPVGLAAEVSEDSNAQPVSRAMEMGGNPSSLLWSPPATPPLVKVARQQVAEQAARPEPEPVPPEEPLPPGTVSGQQPPSSRPPRIPLPLPVEQSGDEPPDIALDPEVWMAETVDWTVYEQNGVAVRYPAARKNLVAEEGTGVRINDSGQTIQVWVEPYETQTKPDTVTVPPEIETYRRRGYTVNEVTVKGAPAWEVMATTTGVAVYHAMAHTSWPT